MTAVHSGVPGWSLSEWVQITNAFHMPIVKVSPKFQVVIPKELRERYEIKPGTVFRVRVEEDVIFFEPAPLAKKKKRPIKLTPR
jgi:AbrB family looped-hinge helix DNA binding protein